MLAVNSIIKSVWARGSAVTDTDIHSIIMYHYELYLEKINETYFLTPFSIRTGPTRSAM